MIELNVTTRTVKGKKNKSLLAKGIAPGSIDIAGKDTVLIQLDQRSLIALMRAGSAEKVMITVDDKDKYLTIISEIYVNPLYNKVESFSLTELTPKSHVTVRVPIVVDGISPAVKNNLGVLVMNLPSVRITANSENLVEEIVIDISKLETVGARLLVDELPGIKEMKLASEKDRYLTVVTIRPLQKIDILKTAEQIEDEAEEGAEGTVEAAETPAEGTAEATSTEE